MLPGLVVVGGRKRAGVGEQTFRGQARGIGRLCLRGNGAIFVNEVLETMRF